MTKIAGSANQNNNQSIKRQKFIKDFRQKYPEESKKLSDAIIGTIFDKKIRHVGYSDGYINIFSITIENHDCSQIDISSTGRYKINDWYGGCDIKTYYAADGTKLKYDYYSKVEEKERMNRPIRKREGSSTIYVNLSNYKNCYLDKEINKHLDITSSKIASAEEENGLFASLWSSVKNKFNIGDSSNKAREQLKKERQIIEEKGYIDGFEAITGLKATPKNIEDFKNGKIKLKSEQMLEAYKEGQEMAVDIEGDLISGAAAFTVYSAAVIAAPLTGGASIAVGAAAAATIGAITKPVVKIAASGIGDYNYEGFMKDAATGAFSGVLAPVSAGLGGAVGKTTAKALGVQAVKHIGKKGAEETAKTGLKETIKTGMLNPAGYKYTANSFIKREAALASELVTDGVTAGTIDGGFRAGVESGWNAKEIGKGALIGGAGGFVLSPVIGRTLRTTGKLGHKVGLSNKELLKFELPKMYEKATPMQKQVIDEILNSESLLSEPLVGYNYADIINPNRGKVKISDKISYFMAEVENNYFNETEVEEILAARLKILRQLKENPELLDKERNVYLIRDALTDNERDVKSVSFLGNCDIKEVLTKTETLKKQMLEHPQMYVSGEYDDITAQNIIRNFFNMNYELLKVSSIFDNETINTLMRKRLNTAHDYLSTVRSFSYEDLMVLSCLCNSSGKDGKAFTAAQKIEFIDLIRGYKDNKIDVSVISNAVKDGKVDLIGLHKILLGKVFKKIGFTDAEIESIPTERMAGWDFKYIHLLAKSIKESEDETYNDLIRAASLDDFMRYLHDGSNDYGKANLKTKEIFENKGWDYEAYLKPNKENEVKLIIKDKNSEQLAQSGEHFANIIEQLMQPPLDKVVKKQLGSYIQNDKFVIPNNVLQSKDKLNKFMEGVLKNLDNIKKRAEGNLTNPDIDDVRRQNAKNTVTKFSDMQRIIDNVKSINIEDKDVVNKFDLTIKMIDRVPQKDIFQGNYSTCCIGQGEFNERAMAHYLMNTSYNMIELVDNDSGKTIGNALCYFVEDKNGNPYFIIDNIEINNAYRCSKEAGKKIRGSITDYASKVVKQITGKDDIHICMSDSYNDVTTSDLHSKTTKVKFIGDVETKHQYMDLFGGWESDFKGRCNLHFLK